MLIEIQVTILTYLKRFVAGFGCQASWEASVRISKGADNRGSTHCMMYVCMYVCMHVCMYVCMYCMYVCMYVCM